VDDQSFNLGFAGRFHIVPADDEFVAGALEGAALLMDAYRGLQGFEYLTLRNPSPAVFHVLERLFRKDHQFARGQGHTGFDPIVPASVEQFNEPNGGVVKQIAVPVLHLVAHRSQPLDRKPRGTA